MVFLPDPQVSRNHAVVRRLGDADYYLIDSGSSNGSKVNEKRITTPTLLHNGDRITSASANFASLRKNVSRHSRIRCHYARP